VGLYHDSLLIDVTETENEGFLLINGNTADLLIEEINKAISLNISMQNPSTLDS
jgi:hypothetical protein